jgi:hypothetical protein
MDLYLMPEKLVWSSKTCLASLEPHPYPLSPASGGIFNMKWRGGLGGEVKQKLI